MTRELSDEQLVKIVRGLACLHLEIERGVRDSEALGQRMDPQAEYTWRRLRRAERPLPGGHSRAAQSATASSVPCTCATANTDASLQP